MQEKPDKPWLSLFAGDKVSWGRTTKTEHRAAKCRVLTQKREVSDFESEGLRMDDDEILKEFPRSRKTRKSSTTQLRIIDAYLKLMETTAFDKVAVSDIVAQANVTRSTFYAYFTDIYDALEYVEGELVAHLPRPKEMPTKPEVVSVAQPPTPEQCEPPAWYRDWFSYVEFFNWQLGVLLGPNGNPQFPHKMRKAIREAHLAQTRLDGFTDEVSQEWLLNALSDFQLRMAKDLIRAQQSPARDEPRQQPVYFLNAIRVGGWYLRHIDLTTGKHLHLGDDKE